MSQCLKTKEEMWRIIEGYGIRCDMNEKSTTSTAKILQLYELVRKNKHLKRDIQMVARLQDYIEKIKKP